MLHIPNVIAHTQRMLTVALGLSLVVGAFSTNSLAVDLFFTDAPKNVGLALGTEDAFAFGGWGFDDTAFAGTNEFLEYSAGGDLSGAGLSAHIDTLDAAFGGDGLNDGNVIRYSMWIASDPALPLSVGPGFIDVLKLEFYDEALADANVEPQKRVLDTDIDLGVGEPFEADINTTEWKQFVHTYEVDELDFFFQNVGDDLSVVEEIRAVMFVGDFDNMSDQAGSMFIDRVRVELFDNAAAEAASPIDTTNPGALIPPSGSLADLDTDNDVDGRDFLLIQRSDPSLIPLWESDFGNGVGPLGGVTAVPEPSSAMLILVSVLCLGRARRHDR